MRVNKFQQVGKDELRELVRQTTRNVHTGVIHCAATKPKQNVSVQDVEKMHKARGWKGIGYNLYITKDGKMWKGRNWNQIPAHVGGFNSNTLGICYEGGLNSKGKPEDTRTPEQLQAMKFAVKFMTREFKRVHGVSLGWKGHRDYSPDKNGDGKIEPWEFMKACPCFDVRSWCKTIGM